MEIKLATQMVTEFDRQVDNLLHKDYPEAAELSEQNFLKHIEPLRVAVDDLEVSQKDLEYGHLPFVIVVKSDLVSATTAMALIEREGKQGITRLFPREPEDFKPIGAVTLPDKPAYLLVDIDRGKQNINLPPNEAMKLIVEAGRSPITIDEGIAIVTQHPDFLMKNNCFSLLASRHSSDKRVPAIWINGKKQPNLGWCWDGNPHTWLGSASCMSRVS
jgi:hypothetical protein